MNARTLIALGAALACAVAATPASARRAATPGGTADSLRAWSDAAGVAHRRIAANGTTLHVADYGGAGTPLVFLAGLGNSAHVFDEFAPRFTDAHRVIALTRRGYGESGRPKGGYDTATLTEDVRELLDSLGLDRVVLVGHSVAGDELTEFAARHPERVAGLAYLDAAYDRSHTTRRLVSMAVLGQIPPAPPRASGRDRASAEAAQRYVQRLYGVRWPLSEVRATREFDDRGRWVRDGTPASTNGKVIGGETAPRWTEVRAPVLAIYTTDRGEERNFPWIETIFVGRGVARLKASRFRAAQSRWEAGQRRDFARAIPSARVVEMRGASHYVFLSDADAVEREVREFAKGLE